MAGGSSEMKKRKRISEPAADKKNKEKKGDEISEKKKVKLPNKPLAPNKEKPIIISAADKNKLNMKKKKPTTTGPDAPPKNKREQKLRSKQVTEARKKKRKPHYTLEQELALLWEKMRRRNIAKQDRTKFVSEALCKMKGKIHEIACSHVSSRVLQTCVKYCSQSEKDAVFNELRPHFINLASNTYSTHVVKKILSGATKNQFSEFISLLQGHVASLLRSTAGSVVVDQAYDLCNTTQKQSLLMELYSPELKLFKDLAATKESRLEDIITKLGLQKVSVLKHMNTVFRPILEKGIVDHSIIHKALLEYFTVADQTSATDVIRQLSAPQTTEKTSAADVTQPPLLVRMIHTREGSRIAMLCLRHSSAKERKLTIKGMKGHVHKTALDQYGSLVLAYIFSIVDDTKLVSKILIRQLLKNLKEIVSDKNARRTILQLLHPNCSRYFSPDDLASFNLSVPSLDVKDDVDLKSKLENHEKTSEVGEDDEGDNDTEKMEVETQKNTKSVGQTEVIKGGKKDPLLRRKELLVDSGLAEKLIDTCIENARDLLRSNFGKEVIYEVATGGADDILLPTLKSKLDDLHETIASLVAQPKHEEEGEEEEVEEHLLENFHSSRTIRKLVLDSPSFASTLWKKALAGSFQTWAQGHSCKVVCAFLESSDSSVREMARKDLQPLIDAGTLKLPNDKKAPPSID